MCPPFLFAQLAPDHAVWYTHPTKGAWCVALSRNGDPTRVAYASVFVLCAVAGVLRGVCGCTPVHPMPCTYAGSSAQTAHSPAAPSRRRSQGLQRRAGPSRSKLGAAFWSFVRECCWAWGGQAAQYVVGRKVGPAGEESPGHIMLIWRCVEGSSCCRRRGCETASGIVRLTE